VQEKWFEAQIELACELRLPLFLHEREAHKRLTEVLAAHRNQLGAAVVHCFTGTTEEARRYLDLGFFLGVTGWICDERRGQDLREAVKFIPLDKLMLETDAPFLTPRDLPEKPRDGRNEPAFLPHVARTIAQILKKSPEDIADGTTATAERFFNLESLQPT
jgi:TatD DNase family protein